MTPHRYRPRDRPPWWPATEPWPPTGPPPWMWRARRGRFLWRIGLFLGTLLILLAGAFTAILWIAAIALGLIARPAGAPFPLLARPAGPPVPLIFLALLALITGCTAIALAIRAFRRTAVPLVALVEAAQHVENGDYTPRVTEEGPPEVRALARAFNAMAVRLQSTAVQRRSFLADVTHELRTPLTVIQGTLEGLIDGVYPADSERLTGILEETHLLARLIDDLRTLALAESGALTLRREPVDLAALAAETTGWLRARADAGGVRFRTDLAPNLPPVSLDPARLREVLENLLANALRYTPPGGEVRVRCAPADAAGGAWVTLAVEDTGAGIDPAELPHIFERFAHGRDSSGTGLGLAIVKDLVEAHGGRVTARSALGQGTTIECTFPAA